MRKVSKPVGSGKSVSTQPKPKSTNEERRLRRALRALTTSVLNYLAALDALMKCPATEARGKCIAAAANRLDIANDSARLAHGVTVKGLRKKPTVKLGPLTPDNVQAFREHFNATTGPLFGEAQKP